MQSKHIKANSKVNEQYEKLRDPSSYFDTLAEEQYSCDPVLTVSLLKIRSLRKHSEDIKFHARLFNSDVLALTETQLLVNDSDMEIKENLELFRIYRQNHCTDKYSSMAICVKHNLELENYEYIPILNAIKFDLVDTRVRESRSLLLLYRKNNSNFPQYMQYVIGCSRIGMIIGDFNINYLNEIHSQPLSFMESLNYTQIVTEPTFVSAGSLLDHVYVRATSTRILNNSVVSVFYSDHDAVVTSLQYST